MIDVEDYTDLAYYYANKSNKKNLQGIELDDLYQSAMIGIWIASKTYDDELGAFTTYAHPFIEGEINTLVYKIVQTNGNRHRIPRIKEELISDLLDDEMAETLDHYDEPYLEDKYFMDYLSGIPLTPREKTYFVNIVKYGEKEATALFMTVNGITKQRANQLKQKIRKVAAKHSKELQC